MVNGVRVPGAGLGPACFPSFFVFFCFSPTHNLFCYVQTPHICEKKKSYPDSYGCTCANKKRLLTCKLSLGQYQQRKKAHPGLSQESGIWLLPPGTKGKFQRTIILEILSRAGSSKDTSSSQLCLCTGSCLQKQAIVSCLEGELCDHAFLFQVHHRYCHS